MKKFRFALLIALSFMFTDAANSDAGSIRASDLARIRIITSIDLARDGSIAVYAVKSIHEEPSEKPDGATDRSYRSHLWMIDLSDSAAVPVQLTFGDRLDSSPQISPDGRSVAFARKPAEAGSGAKSVDKPKPQVWVQPLGSPGEARQVTNLEHGAGSPSWYPSSTGLLVSSPLPAKDLNSAPDFPSERPARQPADIPDDATPDIDGDTPALRAWLGRNALEKDPIVHTRLDYQDEHSLKPPPSYSNLFVIDLLENETHQLTDAHRDFNDARYDTRGQSIFYVRTMVSDQHPDRILQTAIYMCSATGENHRHFLEDTGLIIDSPRPDPSGRFLIFRATETNDRLFKQSKIGVLSFDGGYGWLTPNLDTHARDPNPADHHVYFTAPIEGATRLMRVPIKTPPPPPTRLTQGDVSVLDFDVAGGRLVAAIATPENPCELFLLDAEGPTEHMTQLTQLNSEWLADRTIVKATQRWATTKDGASIQYWVMPPADLESGRRHPTVLEIHGGPMAMWGPSEMTMWHEFQLLCAQGFGVVYANPRGSSGYGYEFQRDNFGDWGVRPGSDVLTCLDAAIEEFDWIDQDQLFMTGGSYGGYLTAWILTQTDRFKAAVAQRGVYDLRTFFGEGNAWRLVEEAFGGFPWEPDTRELLDANSPFTFVNSITTPLLIMHSSQDLRTGVSQSEMMYRALKELRRPVEYVRYPGAGHDLSRTGEPNQRLDRLARIIEFFGRYAENIDTADQTVAP